MKKYRILHLPTATYLYTFSGQSDQFMLFSEIEAQRRIQRNKEANDHETYSIDFTLADAEARLQYCYSGVLFSFLEDNDTAEEKESLQPYHVILIEVGDGI
jgi:hypothetical protein